MSMIQSIIGSTVGEAILPPYPAPGFNYPSNIFTAEIALTSAVFGYYEPSTIASPVVGLWRKAYQGEALNGTALDPEFPSAYTVAQSKLDAPVGFGNGNDVATLYTLEWYGYFKPAVTGDFVFSSAIDDYYLFWMGESALNPTFETAISVNSNTTAALPMTAGKYYPVRMIFGEHEGGNECSISFGLNNTQLKNNLQNAAVGQFFSNSLSINNTYPNISYLIT